MIASKDLNKMYESAIRIVGHKTISEGFEQYTKDAYDAEIDRELERERAAEGKFSSISEWLDEGPGKQMLQKMLDDGMKRILPASMEWTVDEWGVDGTKQDQWVVPVIAIKLDDKSYAYVSVSDPIRIKWTVEDSDSNDATDDLIAVLPHGHEDLHKIIKLLIDVENVSTEEFNQVKLEESKPDDNEEIEEAGRFDLRQANGNNLTKIIQDNYERLMDPKQVPPEKLYDEMVRLIDDAKLGRPMGIARFLGQLKELTFKKQFNDCVYLIYNTFQKGSGLGTYGSRRSY